MSIRKDTLDALANGTLDTEAFLQKIEIESQAPSYLKSQIMERTRKLDVQTTISVQATVKKTSKRMELFYYGLKTAAVAAAMIGILFSVSGSGNEMMLDGERKTSVTQEVTEKLNQGSNRLLELLNGFSNKIVNGGKAE